MSTEPLPLPDDPNLEQLRKRARELQRTQPGTQLSAAQLETARRYGFPSWPAIKRYVELRRSYRRTPDEVPEQPRPDDEFLRLGCLTYGDDGPARWARAAAMTGVPDTIWVAAARCDVAVLRRLLVADGSLATREGGPFDWAPLAYLAYARHDPAVSEADTLAAAGLLLEHGADPDTGYLWHGLYPFTLLTGCFGEGEGGPVRQPEHPHGFALARLLLEAGADANDSQTLYNRMFSPSVDHLQLLLEFGLGQGDGGPWKRRLGAAAGSPAELLADQFAWAVVHGYEDRIRLLVAAGVDPAAPLRGHPTLRVTDAGAIAAARRSGQFAAARLLEELGAPPWSRTRRSGCSSRCWPETAPRSTGSKRRLRASCRGPGRVGQGSSSGPRPSVGSRDSGWRSSSAGTSTSALAPTYRPTRSGRRRCTTRPATAMCHSPACCSSSAPTPRCGTPASTEAHWTGRSTWNSRRRPSCCARSAAALTEVLVVLER